MRIYKKSVYICKNKVFKSLSPSSMHGSNVALASLLNDSSFTKKHDLLFLASEIENICQSQSTISSDMTHKQHDKGCRT